MSLLKQALALLLLFSCCPILGQNYYVPRKKQHHQHHSHTRHQSFQRIIPGEQHKHYSRRTQHPSKPPLQRKQIKTRHHVNQAIKAQQERARQEFRRQAEHAKRLQAMQEQQRRRQAEAQRRMERERKAAIDRANKERLRRTRGASRKAATEQRVKQRISPPQHYSQAPITIPASQNSAQSSNESRQGSVSGWIKIGIVFFIVCALMGGLSSNSRNHSPSSSSCDNERRSSWSDSSNDTSSGSGESFWDELRRKEKEEREKEDRKTVYEDDDRTEYIGRGSDPDTLEKQTPGDYAIFDRQYDGTYKERWGDRVLDPDEK